VQVGQRLADTRSSPHPWDTPTIAGCSACSFGQQCDLPFGHRSRSDKPRLVPPRNCMGRVRLVSGAVQCANRPGDGAAGQRTGECNAGRAPREAAPLYYPGHAAPYRRPRLLHEKRIGGSYSQQFPRNHGDAVELWPLPWWSTAPDRSRWRRWQEKTSNGESGKGIRVTTNNHRNLRSSVGSGVGVWRLRSITEEQQR
jgi:hypothetical protein